MATSVKNTLKDYSPTPYRNERMVNMLKFCRGSPLSFLSFTPWMCCTLPHLALPLQFTASVAYKAIFHCMENLICCNLLGSYLAYHQTILKAKSLTGIFTKAMGNKDVGFV